MVSTLERLNCCRTRDWTAAKKCRLLYLEQRLQILQHNDGMVRPSLAFAESNKSTRWVIR